MLRIKLVWVWHNILPIIWQQSTKHFENVTHVNSWIDGNLSLEKYGALKWKMCHMHPLQRQESQDAL